MVQDLRLVGCFVFSSPLEHYEQALACAFAKRKVNLGPMDDETRERKVYEQVDVGEVSRARQTAMPSAPFSGNYEQILDLFPPKPANEPDAVPPPQEVAVPDCDPKFFFKTLCGQSRGTTQTACGWHTDTLKDTECHARSELRGLSPNRNGGPY